MTDHLPSKCTCAVSKGAQKPHAHWCPATGNEALQEIQRLREDLARAESAHAAVMAENAYYKAELACVARVMDDAVLGLRQLRDFANQQWESVQRRMLSNAQTDSDDWCPTCTKPYAECRCNGVAR
jgi:hypothetical protein